MMIWDIDRRGVCTCDYYSEEGTRTRTTIQGQPPYRIPNLACLVHQDCDKTHDIPPASTDAIAG